MSYIKFKGHGIKFGYLSYKMIMTDKNRSFLFDEDGNPNDLGIAKIIYSGYVNNCINKDVEAKITFDEFSRLVDSCAATPEGVDELKEAIKAWTESSDIQDLVKATVEDKEEKKNQEVSPISSESSSLHTESLESGPGN